MIVIQRAVAIRALGLRLRGGLEYAFFRRAGLRGRSGGG